MTVTDSSADVVTAGWVEQIGGGLTAYLLAACANLGLPWVLPSPLSDGANSMRAIVVSAGILLAIMTLVVGRGAGSRSIVAKSVGVILLSILASQSVRWADLGLGAVGALALFSIPALARLGVHLSER